MNENLKHRKTTALARRRALGLKAHEPFPNSFEEKIQNMQRKDGELDTNGRYVGTKLDSSAKNEIKARRESRAVAVAAVGMMALGVGTAVAGLAAPDRDRTGEKIEVIDSTPKPVTEYYETLPDKRPVATVPDEGPNTEMIDRPDRRIFAPLSEGEEYLTDAMGDIANTGTTLPSDAVIINDFTGDQIALTDERLQLDYESAKNSVATTIAPPPIDR